MLAPAWTPLLAAVLGAIAGGGLKAISDHLDRRREDEAILVALASEVKVICDLIRLQDYAGDIDRWLVLLEQHPDQPGTVVVDFRSEYFTVYHALAHSLGRLRPTAATAIVRFYGNCKTVIDCTRPDGVAAQPLDNQSFRSNLTFIKNLLLQTLHLGDEIVQMPKKALAALPAQ